MSEKCGVCEKQKEIISKELGVCLECIRNRFSEAKPFIAAAHKRVREELKLPLLPPKDNNGIFCNICVNQCVIGEGKTGYCGIRKNIGGKFVDYGGATLSWYNEDVPDEKEKHKKEHRLVVFYGACSYNCLFCQSWHFRDHIIQPNIVSPEELASKVEDKTTSIYFYGGDPTPQIWHALETARIVLKRKPVKISFETNGCMSEEILKEIVEIVRDSGGSIKFEIKALNNNIHYALTGVSNEWTLKNFKYVGLMCAEKERPLYLMVSTLLVPGYIDKKEVSDCAKFIAGINDHVRYCLTAFYPQFYMYDLPPTPQKLADECVKAAKEAGVKHVAIMNPHLLR